VAKKKQDKINDPLKITDLSDEQASIFADHNTHVRTLVADFNAELERMHRKYGELERKYQEADTLIGKLRGHLRRRTWALWTGFITLEAKAGYSMSTSTWGDEHWWINLGQAVGLVVVAGYLATPNLRKLLDLSSDHRSGREDER